MSGKARQIEAEVIANQFEALGRLSREELGTYCARLVEDRQEACKVLDEKYAETFKKLDELEQEIRNIRRFNRLKLWSMFVLGAIAGWGWRALL